MALCVHFQQPCVSLHLSTGWGLIAAKSFANIRKGTLQKQSPFCTEQCEFIYISEVICGIKSGFQQATDRISRRSLH